MGSDLLIQAFENFRRASTSLEAVHQELNRKVVTLSRRLEEKNRELERNLTEKEEIRSFLDAILGNMNNGVLVTDRGGRVRIANRAFRRILGEPAGEEAADEAPLYLPPAFLSQIRRALLKRDRFLEVNAGDRVYMVSATSLRPQQDAEELVIYVFNDITDLRRLEEERERKTRLSAMGEMAIQLAHEIRNPLGGIQLYLSLLKQEAADGAAGEWIRNMEAGLAGINYMVTNMLTFHKPIHLNPEFVSPREVLEESVALLQPVITQRGVDIRILNFYQGEVIHADREMLKQLAMNLLRNALNAMPEQGMVKIVVEGPEAGPADDGQAWCRFTFADNGVGMDEEEMARMFEPFWSAQTGGHGIGMWVCRQIIAQHKGHISVESDKGGGTRITVRLPVYQAGDDL